MRRILRTAVGGALALLLALSVTPANALDPLAPDDGVTAVDEQVPLDGAEGSEDNPGGESTESIDGSEGEVTEVQPGDEVPQNESSDSKEAVASDDDVLVAEAPETIGVTGTVYTVPDEPLPQTLEQIEAGEEPVVRKGATLVATDQIGLVRVDEEKSQGALENGDSFSGAVELPEVAIDAVQEKIDTEGELTSTALGEAVALVANAEGVELEAAGVGIDVDAPVAPAPVTRSHPVDVRYLGGSALTAPSRTELESLVNMSSAYWKGQTGGKVSSMPIASYKVMSPSVSRCDEVGLWNQAIHNMGYFNANDYLRSGRHLVVFVNAGCGDAYGWGTIGTLHSGGVTWVDLGARGYGVAVADAGHAMAHELGHNLGLGHSNARQCTSPKVDAPLSGSNGRPTSGSGCSDSEYGDFWSVMGMSPQRYSVKPAALPMTQKKMLGLTDGSMLKEVRVSGGAVQSFTINAVSLTSGVRGLRVATPSPGRTFFVEYRNGQGQDSGLPFSGGAQSLFSGYYNGVVSTGVRVMNAYDAGAYKPKENTVLSRWSGGYRYQTLRAGATLMPYGDTARVVVESAYGNTAKVRVEYKGFRDGGKYASTSVKEGGSLVAGKTLQARTSGRWAVTFGAAPSRITDKYQWLRNGKAIRGATGSSYRTTAADIGQKVSVKVNPYASGWVTNKGSVSAVRAVASPPFIDVLYGQKFYNEINWMKYSGISTGTRTAKGAVYAPKLKVSREAMAAFLYRMQAPKSYRAPTRSPFVDVRPGQSFYKEITWMYKSGLSTGTMRNGQRFYDPKASVSREAMAAFLFRMQAPKSYRAPAKSPFVDMRPGQKFYKEVSWMYQSGLSTGSKRGGKRFYDPKVGVSREAMAAFLYRLKH